jgi:RNAse (barnase) inhibitor barstar
MSAFIFTDQCKAEAVHRAELPAGINSEEALLDAISIALRFPDYFGRNWNALDECICDLSWLRPGDVILIHKDLPLANNRASLSIYLSILRNAVENWNTKGSNLIYASPERWDTSGERKLLVKRKFLVTFPRETKDIVERVLAGVQQSSSSSGASQA